MFPTPFPLELQKLFDINPTFLEVSYSNESLDAWEAGCTWIMDNRVTIQLRKRFKKAPFWFGYIPFAGGGTQKFPKIFYF